MQNQKPFFAFSLRFCVVLLVLGIGLYGAISVFQRLAEMEALISAKTWDDVRALPCREPRHWEQEWRLTALIDPSFPIKATVGNQEFLVPAEYVRVSAWQVNCPRPPGLSFGFWIPDLGPLEGSFLTNARPERTRAPPHRANEHVVDVFSIEPYFDSERPGRRSRAKWMLEERSPPRESHQLTMQFGLSKTAPSKGAVETVWWFRDDVRERMVMECASVASRCGITADFKDMGLSVVLIFDKDAIAYHEVIMRGLRTLLERWRALGPNDS